MGADRGRVFALMIALTIFSRAASSVTKARVVVTKAERQTISHEIRMNGTIEAKDNFMQYVPSGLMVKSLGVSPGQQVQSGDVLFTVDTKKLQEKIGELEAEIAIAKKRENISISRAERTYQNAVSDAKEEKALAYRNYAGTVSAQDGYEAVAREQDKLMRAAALIADSAGGVRVVATFSEEHRAELTEASTVVLKGKTWWEARKNMSPMMWP